MPTLTVNPNVIEDLMTAVRSEIGNAGFAAQVGHLDLAIDALDVAAQNIAAARQLLQEHT